MTGIVVVILCLLVAAAVLAAANFHIVPQSEVYVIERLGRFQTVWETGPHIKIPFVERIAKWVPLREQIGDYKPWAVITKDNVPIEIDAVVFYQITNPMLYTYGVEDPEEAIETLTSTTLRNIVGGMTLDETLTSRGKINAKIGTVLKDATTSLDVRNARMRRIEGMELSEDETDPWGIRIDRVEIQKILVPPEIQETMKKEMTAEREKRATLLLAEARAEAIKLLKEAAPDGEYLKLQAMETFEKAADGKATKIFIPSDMQGLAGLAGLAQGINKAAGPGE